MALLETSSLGQRYDGREVLNDINLEIGRGEVFALIGPTGTGKTTLLRLLDLLEIPSSGKIYFDGTDVAASRGARLEARRRMSFVQQRPVVFRMSVYDNVACALKWRHVRHEVIRQKVGSVLELVGLAGQHSQRARTLSGGETQRVAIARALVTEPEMMFLDEPTANLDPISTARVEEVLARIIREHKTTVVMATHDRLQGHRLASRIGVMIDGQILQVGSPNEIFGSPVNREVAEFVGVENILGGVVVEKDDSLASIKVDGVAIQAVCEFVKDDRVYVLIKPEDITFILSKELSSARNIFEGRITRMAPVGSLVRVEVDCGFPLFGVITEKSKQQLDFQIGKRIYASFKATAVHVIKKVD